VVFSNLPIKFSATTTFITHVQCFVVHIIDVYEQLTFILQFATHNPHSSDMVCDTSLASLCRFVSLRNLCALQMLV